MTFFLLRRLLAFIPTLLVVSVVVFLMIYLIPGDPAMMMLGPDASEEAIQRAREVLGLNQPLPHRFVGWFAGLLSGDLGTSYFLQQPVTMALASRLSVTLSLAFVSLAVALALGVISGIVAAIYHNSHLDWGFMLAALCGLSVPSFWLALNLIFLFAVRYRWFPIGGYAPFSESPSRFAWHLFLPALTLGLSHAAVIARMTRSSMLEVLRLDYVRTARAKGVPRRAVILKHALKNALIPVLTVVGISAGALLGGSVITETVFNLPGVGRLIIDAVKRRDYPVVQAGILLVTAIYLTVNLIVDLLYAWANPRIRYS